MYGCSSLLEIDLEGIFRSSCGGNNDDDDDHIDDGDDKKVEGENVDDDVAEGVDVVGPESFHQTQTRRRHKNNNSIGDSFLCNCKSLTSINLWPLNHHIGAGGRKREEGSRKIASIGSRFLSGCKGLVNVDITPLHSVKRIGEGFMSGCDLSTAILPHPPSSATELTPSSYPDEAAIKPTPSSSSSPQPPLHNEAVSSTVGDPLAPLRQALRNGDTTVQINMDDWF